jgi:hypothetical protein
MLNFTAKAMMSATITAQVSSESAIPLFGGALAAIENPPLEWSVRKSSLTKEQKA